MVSSVVLRGTWMSQERERSGLQMWLVALIPALRHMWVKFLVGPSLPSPIPGATPKPTFPKFQLHLEREFPGKYSPCGDTVTYYFILQTSSISLHGSCCTMFFFYLFLLLHSRYGNIVRFFKISQKSLE